MSSAVDVRACGVGDRGAMPIDEPAKDGRCAAADGSEERVEV